ncbi:MAG: hypothetical protein FGF48_10000 [Candidatus Brockarchaeota archaeon]|nr:hypothetical protein [Candidatus Brockarchaeota archaeon]
MAAEGLRAGSSSAEIISNESMVIAGGIHPRFASAKEGRIRASSLIIEKNTKVCIVSCDVLVLQKDLCDEVCLEIEEKLGIPFENILITATHTHHAPATATIHGYEKDETFVSNVKRSILSAVGAADENLKSVDVNFWLGIESTVGQNSRLLLSDSTIYWVGPRDDALRPTGPFDPDLPVIMFKRRDEGPEAIIFSHSTHNIGARSPEAVSPGFYGLAAQELEEENGGSVLFLPGASGSTHNLTLPPDEMILRIKDAVKEAISESKPVSVQRVASVKREFKYRVRMFDEEKEEKAVSYYCNKRVKNPEPVIEVFRKMRRELSKHQGEARGTWIQTMLIGDIALVGIPGELFTKLGILLKRLSPFRHTYIVQLANDWIGYIPDRQAYDLGGYQVWTGFHSYIERGAGEAMVEEAVQMLCNL